MAAAPLFERIGLPSPVPFLAAGVAAGVLGIAPTGDVSIVTLLLAAYPALEDFGESATVAAMALVATCASLAIQGGTLQYVAARSGRSA